MRQTTLASQGSFERYGRKSRREHFLENMTAIEGVQPVEPVAGIPQGGFYEGDEYKRRQPQGSSRPTPGKQLSLAKNGERRDGDTLIASRTLSEFSVPLLPECRFQWNGVRYKGRGSINQACIHL
jgi:hypothetical protein